MTGLPRRYLHIAIHGFVLEEFTKPAHERNLQVGPPLGKPGSHPFTRTFKTATET